MHTTLHALHLWDAAAFHVAAVSDVPSVSIGACTKEPHIYNRILGIVWGVKTLRSQEHSAGRESSQAQVEWKHNPKTSCVHCKLAGCVLVGSFIHLQRT